ncbi:hypothetical protein [Fibrivirga algicola]|nr:hypothetical protein [Fibrivirga algicola]
MKQQSVNRLLLITVVVSVAVMSGQVAISMHILTLLVTANGDRLTSDFIAGSSSINAVPVHKEIRGLRNKGLVISREERPHRLIDKLEEVTSSNCSRKRRT